MNNIELLAPAGDLERLKIAFKYGADAVYLGGEQYSLRANAKNFTLEDIKRMNIFAINSSFLSDTEKENLIIKYNTLYEEFISNNNQ